MDHITNHYRYRKVGDRYFLTTDHGSHIILTEEELSLLKQDKLDDELKKRLEEREIILTEDNVDEAVRLLRNRHNFLRQGTSLHIMVLTLRCNMNCIYCHASSKNEKDTGVDMDVETARKTVDFIFQSPSQHITIEFQGGEPMLNWETLKFVVKYAKEKNVEAKKDLKITLVTNLSMMDDAKLKFLIDEDVLMCTSLDGPKEVHEHNRKMIGGGNYEQVTGWLKRIHEEYLRRGIKNRRVGALVTLTKKSLAYPKEIVDEYVRLGLKDIHLRFLNRLGVAKSGWGNINYSAEEYLKFWKEAVNYIEELNRSGKEIGEKMIHIMTSKINGEFDPNYLDLQSPCGASIGQLVYAQDGKIYTCDEARMLGEDLFMLGDVREDKYKDIVTSEKACAVTAASVNDQYVCNDCAYKPYCGVCPVCNYAEQGSVVAKIPETDRCKIFMAQFDWVVKNRIMDE